MPRLVPVTFQIESVALMEVDDAAREDSVSRSDELRRIVKLGLAARERRERGAQLIAAAEELAANELVS